MRLRDFLIDERVVEADFSSIRCRIAEENAVWPRPINRSETHRTWFAGGVNLAAFQLEELKFLASLADGNNFRMRGGIVGLRDPIHGLGDDFVALHDDGTERSAAPRADILN